MYVFLSSRSIFVLEVGWRGKRFIYFIGEEESRALPISSANKNKLYLHIKWVILLLVVIKQTRVVLVTPHTIIISLLLLSRKKPLRLVLLNFIHTQTIPGLWIWIYKHINVRYAMGHMGHELRRNFNSGKGKRDDYGYSIYIYVTVCLYARHAYMHTGSYVFPSPMLFKSRNRLQINSKCKISMFFPNCPLFLLQI